MFRNIFKIIKVVLKLFLRRSTSLIPLFALIIPLMMFDCQCFKKPIVIKRVLLEIPSPNDLKKRIDQERFSNLIDETIKRNGNYIFNKEDEDGFNLRLTLIPSGSHSEGGLMLSASLVRNEQEGDKFKAFAHIKSQKGEVSGRDIEQALSEVLAALISVKRGQSQHSHYYRSLIEKSLKGEEIDRGELLSAVSVVYETKDEKAAELLIQLLKSTKDLAIGNACIIALGELKDEKAMDAIIEFAERKPPIIRRQAIEAARQIGSKLAAEWLLVMAYGYEDPTTSGEALAALKEVEKKLGISE